MSKLVIDKENGKGKILDGVFCYIKLQGGSFKYNSKTEKEWTVDIVVDKTTAKAYKKMFPKNSCKEYDNEEFTERFKIDPPFEKQDEQFIVKVKADANLKADVHKLGLSKGDEVPYEWNTRPKLFTPFEDGVKDVTMEVLAANGSKGDAAIKILENDFGTFSQLSGILVKDLIEYESDGSSGSDFGKVIGGYNKGDGNHQQVPVEVATDDSNPGDDGMDDDPGGDFDPDSVPF